MISNRGARCDQRRPRPLAAILTGVAPCTGVTHSTTVRSFTKSLTPPVKPIMAPRSSRSRVVPRSGLPPNSPAEPHQTRAGPAMRLRSLGPSSSSSKRLPTGLRVLSAMTTVCRIDPDNHFAEAAARMRGISAPARHGRACASLARLSRASTRSVGPRAVGPSHWRACDGRDGIMSACYHGGGSKRDGT